MISLSKNTEALINRLFSDRDIKEKLTKLLTEKCAENIPLCNNYTPEGFERIRFAIIKLFYEGEDLNELIKLTGIDWRDLLMNAGFENNEEYYLWMNKILQCD
jgi:hypothetical protein